MSAVVSPYSPLQQSGVRAKNPPELIIPYPPREPTSLDYGYFLGTLWLNQGVSLSVLASVTISPTVKSATWVELGGGSATITGTANQITVTPGSPTVLSLPTTLIAPGSIASISTITAGTALSAGTSVTATTTIGAGTSITAGTSLTAGTSITATLGNITATNGNLVLNTAGNGIVSINKASSGTAGANVFGFATLVGGTVTISTTSVGATSLIYVTRYTIGATGAAATGNLVIGSIVNGASFVINSVQAGTATSLQASDVSVVNWMIIN